MPVKSWIYLIAGIGLGGIGNHFARNVGITSLISVIFYAAGAVCFLGQMRGGGNQIGRMGLIWDLAAIVMCAVQGWVIYGEHCRTGDVIGLAFAVTAIFCFAT